MKNILRFDDDQIKQMTKQVELEEPAQDEIDQADAEQAKAQAQQAKPEPKTSHTINLKVAK